MYKNALEYAQQVMYYQMNVLIDLVQQKAVHLFAGIAVMIVVLVIAAIWYDYNHKHTHTNLRIHLR